MNDYSSYISVMTAQGRPTLYDPDLCEPAHNYCLLGATNDDLAEFFGVSPSTIDNWIARHAVFADAVRRGRVVADARVARGLFDRAVGYDRTVEHSLVVGDEVKTVTSTVHYPPSVQACVFWLRNRSRRTWGDAGRGEAGDRYLHTADDLALLEAAGERARLAAGD